MSLTIKSANRAFGGVQGVYELTFEVEGQDKPVCVAEAVYRMYA